MTSGMSTVITTKLLARMRSIYSRRAMRRTLRIDPALLADGLNEYLLQRRLAHLEPPDLCRLRGEGQQRLCVIAIFQCDLRVATVVFRRCDARVLQKRVAAFEVDLH